MDLLKLMAAEAPASWWVGLIIVGLCVGSFLNVVIYRLPIMIVNNENAIVHHDENSGKRPDLFLPGSHCTHCAKSIFWRHNIPVISWVWLKGKTFCCKKDIGFSYPVIEVSALIITLISAYRITPGYPLLGILLFGWMALALAVIDIKHYLLPDAITYPLLWSGLLFNLNGEIVSLQDAVTGAIAGYSILWLFNYFCSMAFKKHCMGNGDFKLTAAIAAWLGWQCLAHLLLISSLIGVFLIIGLRIISKREMASAIPFGPALVITGWLQLTGFI